MLRSLFRTVIAATLLTPQTPTFRVDVPLVSVDIGVMDASGRPVTNLTQDDFTIYEDGQKQEIRSFSPAAAPYNVILLFDCSGSTRDEWTFLTGAMSHFMQGLKPHDRVAIAEFNTGVRVALDWSARSAMPLSIPIKGSSGGTDVFQALDWAVGKFRGIEGRKSVVLFTDGNGMKSPPKTMIVGRDSKTRPADSADDPQFQVVLRTLRSSSIVFYFVIVDSDLNPGNDYSALRIYDMQQTRSRIEQLADATGGRAAFPGSPRDLADWYRKIGEELGTAYSLSYISSNPAESGRYRRIEVQSRRQGLRVQQSREGYSQP